MKTIIHKLVFCAIAVIVITANLSAQTAYTSLFGVSHSSKPAWLDNTVSDASILYLDRNALKDILSRQDERVRISMPFGANNSAELILERNYIIEPGSKVVAGTVNGDVPVDISGKFVSYAGKISGVDNSLVSISFSTNGVMGLVTNEKETYVLGKLQDDEYVLYQSSKLKISNDFKCGTEAFETPQQIKQLMSSLDGSFDRSTSTFLKADIAIESDYETFIRYGSVANATFYLLSLMSTVSAVYIRDVNVRLVVTYIRVWDTPADPYSGSSSFEFLDEFRGYWNQNMQSVPRTLAHYLTTRSGNLGGVAWLNSLCANVFNGYGYAFSNINGTYNNLPVYSWDVDVTAHETGHNFGSPHTHSCSWPGGPIDTCYAVEGGCYNGPVIPRIGTIMSYCHLNSGKTLVFGPLPIDLIRSRAEAASCMNPITGLLLAKPNGREIFRSGVNALVIWGSSLTGNVNLEYSINNGSSWLSLQNNVPAVNRNYSWVIPYIPTTTQTLVRVSESGAPANNDVSDTVFQIRPQLTQFNMLQPPPNSRFYVMPGDTAKVLFKWSKTGTLPEIKYRWFLSNLSFDPITNMLSDNSGSDTVLTLTKGRIDSIVAANGINFGDSLKCRWNVKSYSMLDSANATTSSFIVTFIRGVIGINPISNNVPKDFFVNQNYPNPFNPATKIKFGLPKSELVLARVYDITGRQIAVLANEKLNPGEYEIDWNAENLPSGVYFVKVETGANVKILRTILLK